MLVVAALGGNALLKRGEKLAAENQRANVKTAAHAVATIVRAGHHLIVTHGNGPQVGLLALQSAAGPVDSQYPLDVLGAESEGMIGYLIEQELRNAIPERSLFATLLTQCVVDPDDPAFQHPTKPIGPIYDEATARTLAAVHGWSIAPDGKYALMLYARDKKPPPPPPRKLRKDKHGHVILPKSPPPDEPSDAEGGEEEAPVDDVAIPPPSGPLSLYRAQLEGAFTTAPQLIVKTVDGAAVWVPAPPAP